MDASFIELAQAARDTHTIGLQTLGRLVGIADDEYLAATRTREARLLEAAELLVAMAPHEALVRSIVRVGGLADLPEYSADLSSLAVDATGLWRGRVLDIMPLECEVRFNAKGRTLRGWVSRADLVGLERIKPSMWLAPTR